MSDRFEEAARERKEEIERNVLSGDFRRGTGDVSIVWLAEDFRWYEEHRGTCECMLDGHLGVFCTYCGRRIVESKEARGEDRG